MSVQVRNKLVVTEEHDPGSNLTLHIYRTPDDVLVDLVIQNPNGSGDSWTLDKTQMQTIINWYNKSVANGIC